MKKVNLIFAIFVFMAVCVGFSSCDDDNYDAPDVKARARYKESGLYLGITGFNDYLNPYVYDKRYFRLLTSSSAPDFKNFVDNFSTDISTVLYYAVDDAITNLEKAKFPDDLTKVALITFTDGLDEGSFGYGTKYSDVTSVNEHLKSARVNKIEIESYSIGIKGNDVEDDAKFKSDLKALASSSSNAMEVSNMSEVDAKFLELAASLYSESQSQSFSLSVPVKPSGVKTRFTFDGGLESVSQSSCYIEGTWSKDGSLVDITYRGLKCTSGEEVSSASVSGSKTLRAFTFTDVEGTDGSDVSITKAQVWNKNVGSSIWNPNSEFDPTKNTETIVEQKSAVIMLVIDCSSSLGNEGLNKIKQTVKKFIDALWISSSPNFCRVTFEPNGGTGTMSQQAIAKGKSANLKANTFTRSGYAFFGWNTRANGTGTSYTNRQAISLSSNITLYAQWGVAQFSVIYNPNGGTGTMSQQGIIEENSSKVVFSENTFTRSGYFFTGWNSRADGTGEFFIPNIEYDLSDVSSNITLYAQWRSGEVMFISSGTNSVYIGVGKIVYLSFTPTQAKTYTFYSTGSNDTYATLYNASWSPLDSDDDDGVDRNFLITREITSSQVGYPVFLAVNFYSSSASGTVSVYVQ